MITTIDMFIINAWLAGVGISLMSAPMGCFIAWQRLVYFGDAVAHAALLGVVLALLSGIAPVAGIVFIAVLVAVLVASLHRDFLLPADTLLGIFAHGSLALGLVIIAISPSITIDVNGLLFGDILAVTRADLKLIFGAAAISTLILWRHWKQLMRYVLYADIAQVEGVNIRHMRLLIMVMIAVIVAISIKLVGILLITSLLILPAAAARMIARSPNQMAAVAVVSSIMAVTGGILASLHFDTPTGPSIILAALVLLVVMAFFTKKG